MRNRSNRLPQTRRRNKTNRWMRATLFSLLVAACVMAVALGSLPPSGRSSASGTKKTAGQSGQDIRNGADHQTGEQISESARHQIQALMQEKATRSPGRKKMDSRLIYGIKMSRGEQIAAGVETLEVSLPLNQQGEAVIDITAHVSPQLLSTLRAAGAKIISSFPQYRAIRVEVSLDAVDFIAELPEVIYLQPEQEPIVWENKAPRDAGPGFDPNRLATTRPEFESRARNVTTNLADALKTYQLNSYNVAVTGVRKSEADTTQGAAIARNTYGFDGTGIKIGILSDGVRDLAAAQASGDVGPVTVAPGQSGTSAGQCATTQLCDEGTAMLELVHDLAPGAQLFFATALGGSANFANNIRTLRNTYNCDIIIDDVFYTAESPFQDGQAPAVVSPTNGGIVTQAVNDVTAAGALYFSSAGNSGNDNDGTSGVWEGDFVDGGPAAAPIGAANGNVHTFPAEGATPAQNFNVLTVASGPVILNWSDPLGGSGNDYDLYALNSTGASIVAASTGGQDGNDDPFEGFNTPAAGSRLVIVKFTGAARFLRLTTNRGQLTVDTPGQTSGHACAADAYGVAATPASGAFPGPHDSGDVVETFSSDGPRKLFFQPDGTEYTPGNVLATGGITRQKPDITGTDAISVTGAGGFPINFGGTSAAAPHVGAIAALLKSANPALTPAQIRTALQSTAIDIETAGVDRDSGNGIVMADAALASLGLTPSAANVSLNTVTVDDVGGNGNDFIEPGERGTLAGQLLNTGNAAATSVTATISTTTPNVFITPPASRSYPDIAATTGTSSSATPFEFVLQEGATYGVNIDFVLTVVYNGTTRTFPFKIPTGRMANISTTLDTTAPTTPPEATLSATGTQTGRLNFTFPISSCGATKTNPGPTSALARRFDSYTFTNTSAATICVTVHFAFSNTALLHAVAYVPTFVPATPSVGYAGDNGGSATNGAGTTQLFSFNVAAGSTFTVVVSESNQNGGLNVPYTLRVSGLPAQAVPANQPPVNSVPAGQTTNEDTPLIFSTANSNAISVADPDAGSNPLEITLNATNGTMTLDGTTGLSFTSGDGTDDASMVFTGSITDINAALDGMSFTPSLDYFGSASVQIITNDQGYTGTGGAQSDTDTVNITVDDVPPDILVRDAISNEPLSGSKDMVFTVVLSEPAAGAVSVNFTTAPDTGGANPATVSTDYTPTSGTLSFAAGQLVQSISVPILADGDVETDETLLLDLTGATGGTIVDSQAVGTITAANPAGTVLISELRTGGPGGPADDFVEIYNNTSAPVTVSATDRSSGWGLFKQGASCLATPVLVGIIPAGTTIIPGRGHYLFVGTAYSLDDYGGTGAAAGDQTLTSDIETDRNVALFSTANLANLSSVTRLDAVGFGTNFGNNCDLLREGSTPGAAAPAGSAKEHTFFRKHCASSPASGCLTLGYPLDTNENVADFLSADVDAVAGYGTGQLLGAPGPENLSSPIYTPGVAVLAPLDTTQPSGLTGPAPGGSTRNFDRSLAAVPNGASGTLSLRRRFDNNSGESITRLRFRIVEITTLPPPGGTTADLRLLSSSSTSVPGVNDPATCPGGITPCTVTVDGTTLETPPAQPKGGGFNSSMSVTLGSPLPTGSSVNLQFLLGVDQPGLYRLALLSEGLTTTGRGVAAGVYYYQGHTDVATPPTAAPARISGSVATAGGQPLAGVTMGLAGARAATAITDASGNYRFDHVATDQFYTVTPALVNYHFNPGNLSFSLLANKTDAVFTAMPDGVIAGNAIDTAEYFVRQHYLDFLGREPDESGFNFWSDQILACGSDAGCREARRIDVSAAYFLSIEFQRTSGLVDGLYRASFGRPPRYAEFVPDSAAVSQNVVVGRADWEVQLAASKRAFIDAFVSRTAFRDAYNPLSNAAFVDALIRNTGVSFSGSERDALVNSLSSGSSRADVLLRIAENEAFVAAKRNQAFVLIEYFGYLRRDPDEAGYNFWLQKLNDFGGNFERAEMVKAFINSGEYRARFGR